jgi:acyl-CoA oxidase
MTWIFRYTCYVLENAKLLLQKKSIGQTRRTDREHLLIHNFTLQAFEHRERSIVAQQPRRIKKLIDDGLVPHDAFNAVQHHLIEVAEAYLERVVLEQFQIATATIRDEKKVILSSLNHLYALSQIEKK